MLNQLKSEKSPYLLQHANNPVNWYPWDNQAFSKAKKENKPIFLSIGYSTCHWCHVMEKESFKDKNVAKLLNNDYVSIKVDREERPDIDMNYMKVCQLMTGSGGWPLTIIMTPDKKPFFAATYIPRHSKYGRIGMLDLLPQIIKAWANDKERIANISESIVNSLKIPDQKGEITPEILELAYEQLEKNFDAENGGFSGAPKFPSPHTLMFLLRYYSRSKNKNALKMAELTLNKMRLGGIFDHLGGGFHRYSTDSEWILPHFEKMIYDNALLAIAYIEAYQITKSELFKSTAMEILDYILNEMTCGGFYSAQDADSEGEEGKFYVWTKKEIRKILGHNADFYFKHYDVKEKGNFKDESTGEDSGKNILFLREIPKKIDMNKLNELNKKLFEERKKRVHLRKDDKILTDWNGLVIAALAKASNAFENDKYLNAAKKSVEFIFLHLHKNNILLHRFRESADIEAKLDDYAFLSFGLIELYEATFEIEYLKKAKNLTDQLIENFWDEKGGFYFTSHISEPILVRQKELYDGALPSGNSVALMNLIKLSKITGQYTDKINLLISNFAGIVKRAPNAFTFFLMGYDFFVNSSFEIVFVEKNKEMLYLIKREFIPNKIVVLKSKDTIFAKYISDKKIINSKPTAYVCSNFSCKNPTNSVEILRKQLGIAN